MGAERLSMRKTREILRQKWELRRSHREVAQSLSVGLGTVSDVVHRARRAGLDWAQVHTLAEDALELIHLGQYGSREIYGIIYDAETEAPVVGARVRIGAIDGQCVPGTPDQPAIAHIRRSPRAASRATRAERRGTPRRGGGPGRCTRRAVPTAPRRRRAGGAGR